MSKNYHCNNNDEIKKFLQLLNPIYRYIFKRYFHKKKKQKFHDLHKQNLNNK